jgi:hypothetical protein
MFLSTKFPRKIEVTLQPHEFVGEENTPLIRKELVDDFCVKH